MTIVKKAEKLFFIFFCECNVATSFWDEVVECYNSFGYKLEYLTDVQIILGDHKLDPILNRINLITKSEIFRRKNQGYSVPLSSIIQKLKYQFQIELFIATRNGRLKSFRGLWSPIYTEMQR